MDVLSAVLREMRFDSAGYRRLELRAPWGMSFHQEGLRGVHIVVRGRCEIAFEGGPARTLETGDLVVAPRADPHLLRSVVRDGAAGEETTIVCGAFVFHEADHPALAALPRFIHVPGEGGRVPKWLAAYVDALTSEASEEGPGSDVVMARLSGALVGRALRFHVQKSDEPGWLTGLQDPHVARALAVMHEDFKRPWTVDSLARRAGLSRAAFAARFAHKVGDTPMQYLLRCRMRHAIAMLRDHRATLSNIAERVGYGSEAAFSAAFKRHTGLAPGAYRRADRKQGER